MHPYVRSAVIAPAEEIHRPETHAMMHGPVVASIAVGKIVGVAPGADLYDPHYRTRGDLVPCDPVAQSMWQWPC